MSDKPSYLGLLNAVAIAESQAHVYLTKWIEVTTDPDVRAVLATVAAREGEHGMSFAKRINELGYSVIDKDDPKAAERMAIAGSDRSDLEKMELLGLNRLDTGDEPDVFDKFFTDHSIDIATGTLLGRYIAEERDSGRLLRGCYAALCARQGTGETGSASDDRLGALEAKIDAVCAAIGELQLTLTASAGANGTAKPKDKTRS